MAAELELTTTRRNLRKFSSAGRTTERKRENLILNEGLSLRPARNPSEVGPGIALGGKTRILNGRKGDREIGLGKKIGLKKRNANGKKTDLARDPRTEVGSGRKIGLRTGPGKKTRIANGEKIDRENVPEKETGPKTKITKGKKIGRGRVIGVKKPSRNIVIVVVPAIVEEGGRIIQNMPNNSGGSKS